jgi:hypothetical protein
MTMVARARRSHADAYAYGAFPSDDRFAELSSGEPICAPHLRRRGNALLQAYIVIVLMLAGGWAVIAKPELVREWSSNVMAAISPLNSDRATVAVAPSPTSKPALDMAGTTDRHVADVTPSVPQPLVSKEIEAAPGESGAAPSTSPSTAAVASEAETAESAPMPQPAVDPADPYQVRASAVGLHPELSRVLLARLTPTDYRNARIAIETAVAKTPDTETFVWPRQRKPELAVFEVHFVPGAAPNCRRYVVTVTKDGWSTTALPMEKCGSNLNSKTRHTASKSG